MLTAAAVQPLLPSRNFTVPRTAPTLREVSRCLTLCSTCSLHHLCLPCGLKNEPFDVDQIVYARKRLRRGEVLYRTGDPFKSLYAARTGFFKSYMILADGRSQITGFQMSAEIMGLDGIETGQHTVSVVALDDGEVCVIPYAQLDELSRRGSGLRNQIHRVMSREIVRTHGIMMLLGSMRAEERVAAFLLNLSERFAARGYSAAEFNLRMTREETGSYLGLKLETVSRIVSKFQECGLIAVRNRCIRILDAAGLRRVMNQDERHATAA